MEKDEVLAKNRAEERDEMDVAINDKSSHVGVIVIVAVCMFFSATIVLNNGEPFFEFPAIMLAYMSGLYFNSAFRLKNGGYLAAAICFALAFVCMLVLYFINWCIKKYHKFN